MPDDRLDKCVHCSDLTNFRVVNKFTGFEMFICPQCFVRKELHTADLSREEKKKIKKELRKLQKVDQKIVAKKRKVIA